MMKLTDVVNRINGNVDRFTTDLEYYIGGEHFESRELGQASISSGSKEPRSALESRRVSLGAHWVD